MKLIKPFALLFTATLALSSCNSVPKNSKATASLKNVYEKDFYIGVAIDTNQIKEISPLVTNLIAMGAAGVINLSVNIEFAEATAY